MQEIYRGFSHPGVPLAPEILDAIAGAHMAGVAAAFVDRFEEDLEASAPGLAAYLAGWSDVEPGLSDIWNTAFGNAEALLRIDEVEAHKTLVGGARLGLAMQAAGLAGSFRARFEGPAQLCVDGIVLPAAKELESASDGRTWNIRLDGGRRVALAASDGGWQTVEMAAGSEQLRRIVFRGCGVDFVTAVVLGDERQPGMTWDIAEATDEVLAAWRAALELVSSQSDSYFQWISRGMTGIIPVRAPNDEMISGSFTERWGEIYMTSALPPLALCEMMVHETSHQHYFLAGFLSPMDDGSDRQLYYSPVKKTGRPIGKILLAYHAFANVILFFRQCRTGGIAVEKEEKTILPEVEQLERALRETKALTEVGRSLWEPLAARLEETAS